MDIARDDAATSGEATGTDPGVQAREARKAPSEEQVREWLVAYLARLLDIDPAEVDPSVALERFGLDSAAAVALAGDLSRWVGVELEPSLTRGHPTIDGVARHVSRELAGQPSPAA